MALGESLPTTPSWAVASVTALLIVLSLLLEHSLHLLSTFVSRRKRKSLNQAVDQLKSGLRSMGFITLLLTVANKPMSKICIPESNYQSFLPCVDDTPDGFADSDADETCGEMGSSMKETIFADQVVAGLRHWHSMAKRNLSATKSKLNRTSSPAANSQSSSRALWPLPCPRLFASPRSPRSFPSARVSTAPRSPRPLPRPRPSTAPRSYPPPTNSRDLISPRSPPSLSNPRYSATTSPHNSAALQSPRGGNSPDLFSSAAFEFPNLMRELVEIQKITEEMARNGGSGASGEASFRMWWSQEIFSPIGGRAPSDRDY